MPAQHLTWLILWAIYLFGVYTPSVTRFRRQQVAREHTRWLDFAMDMSVFFGWQVLPLVYILSPWFDFADYRLPVWVGWLGLALLAAAVYILFLAYHALGGNWSPKIDIREGQQLVTHGIFSHMRHPIYAGIWLWAIAQPLILHNWIAGPLMAILFLPLYIVRVPREEAMLLEHFGERYRDYMAGTGRLWPLPHRWVI